MHLKKSLFVLTLMSAVGAVHAEDISQTITLTADSDTSGSFSAGWGVTHKQAGAFTDTLIFANGLNGTFSSSLVTIGFFADKNLDFTSATANGQSYVFGPNGALESGSIGPVPITTPIVITIKGVAAPTLAVGTIIAASYAGTGNVTSPVPELQSYAMMLAGLGVIVTLGRRRMPR